MQQVKAVLAVLDLDQEEPESAEEMRRKAQWLGARVYLVLRRNDRQVGSRHQTGILTQVVQLRKHNNAFVGVEVVSMIRHLLHYLEGESVLCVSIMTP